MSDAVLVFAALSFPACDRYARLIGDIRYGFPGAASEFDAVWSFWRPRWAQNDIGHSAFDDGRVHRCDWSVADLQHDWTCGASASGAFPVWPRAGARGRMGRRGAAGDRECASQQARLVWHVPSARRTARWGSSGELPHPATGYRSSRSSSLIDGVWPPPRRVWLTSKSRVGLAGRKRGEWGLLPVSGDSGVSQS
jgi:hypothetical protein